MATGTRLLRLAAPAMLGIALACGCSSSPEPPPAALGTVFDVLAGDGPAAELAGGLPAMFLTGPAATVDDLLAKRTALAATAHFSTLVDCGGMAALDSTALADRLLEAALEDGGPILLDLEGSTSRSLRGLHAQGLVMVSVDAESRVVSVQQQ